MIGIAAVQTNTKRPDNVFELLGITVSIEKRCETKLIKQSQYQEIVSPDAECGLEAEDDNGENFSNGLTIKKL